MTVRDDDAAVARIEASRASVTEDLGCAGFTLTLANAAGLGGGPDAWLDVPLVLTQTGAFLAGADPVAVRMRSLSREVCIPLDDDQVAEANGTVTATVTPSAGDVDEPDETFAVALSNLVHAVWTPGGAARATGTIEDNDLSVVTIGAEALRVSEGDDIVYLLRRTGARGSELTVYFDQTRGRHTDSLTASFGVGEDTALVTYTTPDDTEVIFPLEFPYRAAITPKSAYRVGSPGSVSLTVIDDDGDRTLSLAVQDQPAAFPRLGDELTFTYTVTNNGAYPATNVKLQSAQFPTAQCLRNVGANRQGTCARAYTITQVDVDAGAVVIAASATGLADDQGFTPVQSNEVSFRVEYAPAETIAIAERVRVTEATDAAAELAVTLSAASDQAVQVQYATEAHPGTGAPAMPDEDYLAATGTLTFAPGGALTQTISIAIVDDRVDEPRERFRVRLASPRYARLGNRDATVTIIGADAGHRPAARLQPRQPAVGEADGEYVFDVVLSTPSGHALWVEVEATGEGTATIADDYNEIGIRVLRFQPGDTRHSLTVTVNDDSVVEADETFELSIGTSQDPTPFTIPDAHAKAVGTIRNDDAVSGVRLSVLPEQLAEAAGATAVTVAATVEGGGVLGDDTAVTVAAAAGSAQEVADYAAVAEFVLTIAGGEASASGSFTFTPVNDAADEPDETVTISGAVDPGTDVSEENAVPVSAATLTIEDDDARGVVVTPGTLTVNEGETGTYAVVLASAPSAPASVAVQVPSTVDEAVFRVTPARLDFTDRNWNAPQTITVHAHDDRVQGTDRTVAVGHAVAGGDYAEVTAAALTVTVEDTTLPTLTVAPVRGYESAGSVEFDAVLDLASTLTVTVAYATADVTAKATEDYGRTAGTLTFAPHETVKLIRVAVVDDRVDEAQEETFELRFDRQVGTRLARAGAPATILDDDRTSITTTWTNTG